MHTIAVRILENAAAAGTEAAAFSYDCLTPETARRLVARGSDIVPDFADAAARVIAAAELGILDSAKLRDTRIATLAQEVWSESFRAAWPAADVAALAMSIKPDGFDFDAHRASYEDMSEEELFAQTTDGES